MLTHTYYLSFTKYAQPIGWKVFSIGFWKSYFRMISKIFNWKVLGRILWIVIRIVVLRKNRNINSKEKYQYLRTLLNPKSILFSMES